MTYEVRYARLAKRQLRRVQKQWLPGIRAACDALSHNPLPHGAKKLSPGHRNRYRIRTQHDVRITYVLNRRARTVEIVEILPRGGAYRTRS